MALEVSSAVRALKMSVAEKEMLLRVIGVTVGAGHEGYGYWVRWADCKY